MANDTTKKPDVKDATEKVPDKQASGQLDPKWQGLGKALPNKRLFRVLPGGKM